VRKSASTRRTGAHFQGVRRCHLPGRSRSTSHHLPLSFGAKYGEAEDDADTEDDDEEDEDDEGEEVLPVPRITHVGN